MAPLSRVTAPFHPLTRTVRILEIITKRPSYSRDTRNLTRAWQLHQQAQLRPLLLLLGILEPRPWPWTKMTISSHHFIASCANIASRPLVPPSRILPHPGMARPMVVALWWDKWAFVVFIVSNSPTRRKGRYVTQVPYAISIIRLKHGNVVIRGSVPTSPSGYDKK